MKNDTQELLQVRAQVLAHEAGAPDAAAPRMDLYTAIHKALRAWMSAVMCRLGSLDVADAAETDAALAELDALLAVMQGHLETENTLVHPVIEARHPGALAAIEADHAHHEQAFVQLRALAQVLQAAPVASATGREAAALALYRAFALFVAENLTHMQVEETHNQALLWAAYTDDELLQVHERILASLPPYKMLAISQWMLPAVSHGERVAMMAGMQAGAPAEFFTEMLGIAQQRLSPPDWVKLTRALGLAQQPGLVHMA